MRDGRTSYPSGHAAETFMAFGLLSVYLMAKLKLFTRQSQVSGACLRDQQKNGTIGRFSLQ
jgi:membrane-associated phospholipid phosphatase